MTLAPIETPLPGCFVLQPRRLADDRGAFVKTFHRGVFQALGLHTDWTEQYYSISYPGVLRGLHFQLPPHDHAKLVYCVAGHVRDVALDLRKGSPTHGQHFAIELSAERANMIYLPAGVAHGFCTYDEAATLVYNVTSVYESAADAGIRWDTANIEWPHQAPRLSVRDRAFPSLADFDSPFSY